jgi:hypothetical protein
VNPSLAVTGDPGEEKAEQLPEVPLAKPTGQSALRASSLPTAPPETADTGTPLTEGDRLERARKRAEAAQAKLIAALSGPSLWHSPPSSLEDARGAHHMAAGHWRAVPVRWARLVWGYGIHLPAKGAGHLLDWLTSSPVITFTALAIWAACHYWLLHWLPWF